MEENVHVLASKWSGIPPMALGYGKQGGQALAVGLDAYNYASVIWDEFGEPTCSVITMLDDFDMNTEPHALLRLAPHDIQDVSWYYGSTQLSMDANRNIVEVCIPEAVYYEWFVTKTQYL